MVATTGDTHNRTQNSAQKMHKDAVNIGQPPEKGVTTNRKISIDKSRSVSHVQGKDNLF